MQLFNLRCRYARRFLLMLLMRGALLANSPDFSQRSLAAASSATGAINQLRCGPAALRQGKNIGKRIGYVR